MQQLITQLGEANIFHGGKPEPGQHCREFWRSVEPREDKRFLIERILPSYQVLSGHYSLEGDIGSIMDNVRAVMNKEHSTGLIGLDCKALYEVIEEVAP